MDYTQTVKLIVDAIQNRINEGENDSERYEQFYVGKTGNFKHRWDEHNDKGITNIEAVDFNEMYKLVEAPAGMINQLEIDLIRHFEGNPKMLNKIGGGGGNPNANVLYVLFRMVFVGDEKYAIHSVGNDDSPLADGFPLSLYEPECKPNLYE